jgi:SAM-dependent methyltransferase
MADRLVWGEAEALPFGDGSFDAVYSIGGFNYFRDQSAALAEMRRVARSEAPVIVADEVPDLYRFAPGHALGFDALDRWSLRLFGLDPEFIAMVLDHRGDPATVARAVLPGSQRYPIWNRLGYCLVDHESLGSR